MLHHIKRGNALLTYRHKLSFYELYEDKLVGIGYQFFKEESLNVDNKNPAFTITITPNTDPKIGPQLI